MNKLLIGAMALSLVAASAAFAQPDNRDQGRQDNQYQHHDDHQGGYQQGGDHRDSRDHHRGHQVCHWRYHHRVCYWQH